LIKREERRTKKRRVNKSAGKTRRKLKMQKIFDIKEFL
jgi:hypothetical protein